MDVTSSKLGLKDLVDFFASFSSTRPLLVSDYDGTLAPFHRERSEAVPSGKTIDLMQSIIEAGGDIIILSGRKSEEIHALLGLSVEIWGCHGWEHRTADGILNTMPLSEEEKKALMVLPSLLSVFPDDALERKPVSTALHWRGREDIRGMFRQRSRELLSQMKQSGLEALPFDGGVEFRIPSFTKGVAMERILSTCPGKGPICYLGDDVTDEDAFRVLVGRGLGILVSATLRETSARVWICPEQVNLFLEKWCGSLNNERIHGQ